MHPELIKANMRIKHVKPTDLARELGLSHTCVAHVIAGRGKSERIARRIVEITGFSASAMWPGKYPQLM